MCKMINFSNEWFHGAHYIEQSGGHYAFAIYGLLQYIAPYGGRIVTSIDMIREYFSMSEDSRTHMKHLKNGIKFLYEQEMIEFYSNPLMTNKIECDVDMIKGKSMLFIKLINLPQNRMTLIKQTEFEKIIDDVTLSSNTKMEMLCYFSAIISHININENVSYASMELLKTEAKIGRYSTCISYNKKLVEIGIMIYGNAGTKSRNTNSKCTGEANGNVSNTYARPEHQFELDQYIHNMQESQRAFQTSEEIREKGRKSTSLKMRINNARKRLAKYTDQKDIDAEKANLLSLEAQYRALTGKHPDEI